MKNIIFSIICFISLQNILYAMETDKALKVKQFLINLNVDLTDKKADKAITHFKKEIAGIPICITRDRKSFKPLSPFQRFLQKIEKILLHYPLSEWRNNWYLEKLRKNNCYQDKKEYQNHPHRKVYKDGNAVVAELRKQTQIPQNADISVFEKDFYCKNFFKKKEWAPICYGKFDDNKLRYQINTNSWFNNTQSPDTIRFALAHELAHAKRGFWTPYRNLLLTKAILGGFGLGFGLIVGDLLFKDSTTYTKLIGCGLGFLQGVITGNIFAGYFQRKEEKACDLSAIESIKTDKGIKEYFSLKPQYSVLYYGQNWAIGELIIENKSSTYTAWDDTHPCQEERISYCQEYANQLGYNSSN